jgi:MYXO-CTERM domain-containing protein
VGGTMSLVGILILVLIVLVVLALLGRRRVF